MKKKIILTELQINEIRAIVQGAVTAACHALIGEINPEKFSEKPAIGTAGHVHLPEGLALQINIAIFHEGNLADDVANKLELHIKEMTGEVVTEEPEKEEINWPGELDL